MNRLLMTVVLALAGTPLMCASALAAEPIQEKMEFDLSLACPTLIAIEVAFSEGIELGSLPTNSADLGLARPEEYSSKWVKRVSYTPKGEVSISFNNAAELQQASGKTVVFAPTVNGKQGSLRWRMINDGGIPRQLLPQHVCSKPAESR